MILSNISILEAMRKGRIKMLPQLNIDDLRPAGIRVHLGAELLIPNDGQTIDPSKSTEVEHAKHDLNREPYRLSPGQFILAKTLEQIKTLPDILAMLDGRSAVARNGISIHNACSQLDGCNEKFITPVLELANHGNCEIVLRLGMPIGMIYFELLTTSVGTITKAPSLVAHGKTLSSRLGRA